MLRVWSKALSGILERIEGFEGIVEGRWDLRLLGRTRLLLITEALPSKSTHCPREGLGTVCFTEEWGCALCCSRRERL